MRLVNRRPHRLENNKMEEKDYKEPEDQNDKYERVPNDGRDTKDEDEETRRKKIWKFNTDYQEMFDRCVGEKQRSKSR